MHRNPGITTRERGLWWSRMENNVKVRVVHNSVNGINPVFKY